MIVPSSPPQPKAQCVHSELSVHTQGSGCTLRAQCAYTRLSVHTQNSTRVCRVKEENYGGRGRGGDPPYLSPGDTCPGPSVVNALS